MDECEVTSLLWSCILQMHSHMLKYSSPVDILGAIVHVSSKLGLFVCLEMKNKNITTKPILLKCLWEARNDLILMQLQWTYHELTSWLKMILKWSSQGSRPL